MATAAATVAAVYYGDYDCGDYAYTRAYEAAFAVARDGSAAADSAATAAYLGATVDVERALDYNDSRAAEAYLQFAYYYDYYVTDGADGDNSANGADDLDGANGTNDAADDNADNSVDGTNSADGDNDADYTYRTELDAAVNAPLDDDEF
jgi:hypothetical protein